MGHEVVGSRRYSRSTRLLVAFLAPALTACIPGDAADSDDGMAPIVAEARALPASTSTTTPPPPTTVAPDPVPTTTVAAGATPGPDTTGAEFVAMFDNDTGLEEFDTFVFHRDGGSGEWIGDHDRSCGPPDPGREIVMPQLPPGVSEPTEEIYLCRDHLMTSMESVSAYSIVGFAPDQVFERSESSVVSWDVNVTDLGDRQWWEVLVIPAGTSHVVCHPHIIDPCGADLVDEYAPGTAMFGIGPFAEFQLVGDQVERQPGDKPCGAYPTDPEGCASKAIRRRFTMTDNRDGTITVDYPEADRTWTVDGSFPERFEVVFKDHNYTPQKDNDPPGFTWHWDNVIVR
jgi:hypothetical protein